MTPSRRPLGAADGIRPPAVAGVFFPADPEALRRTVDRCLDGGASLAGATGEIVGLLVPHAGLVYSGSVAGAAWRLLREEPGSAAAAEPTVVILGTNHGAGWLRGLGAWDVGAWRTPLGDVAVDEGVAAAIVAAGAATVDNDAHRDEHSIEVQLPLLQVARPGARIVPIAVATGTGASAVAAGSRLGDVLAGARERNRRLVLAISTDLAHFPTRDVAEWVTDTLLPPILAADARGLAEAERSLVAGGQPGLVCGMCGIEPAVVGLAALRAMGATRGTLLGRATSADAGGPADRVVGYLAVAFGM